MRRATIPKLSDAELAQGAECLGILAHPQRLRMIEMLLEGRYTVGALAEACAISSAAASTHLRLLQHCGLLRQEREGKSVYYRPAQPCLAEILDCMRRHFGARQKEQA